MAKMKIGAKSKKKQPNASYAVSVSMAPQEEKEPEVVEVEKIVERVVEKVVEVEVPVRLGDSSTTPAIKDCTLCMSHKEMVDTKVEKLEGVIAASGDEIQDLVEGMSESVKVQDRRIKELEMEVDRELSSQMNDLHVEMEKLKAENTIIDNKLASLEKAGWGMIIVSGLIMLMIMST